MSHQTFRLLLTQGQPRANQATQTEVLYQATAFFNLTYRHNPFSSLKLQPSWYENKSKGFSEHASPNNLWLSYSRHLTTHQICNDTSFKKSNKTLAVTTTVKKLQKDSDHIHILTTDAQTARHGTKKFRSTHGISREAGVYGYSMETGYFHGLPFNTPFGTDAMRPTWPLKPHTVYSPASNTLTLLSCLRGEACWHGSGGKYMAFLEWSSSCFA